ncbi:MAG: substrate-binding domain-containing protein, partial [Tropicimonas sp.]|uniref:substrate-binding domain-containing protein n=1 Tax=Tropicimonas sp. TaxID=2067044 RepID=UPI003A83D41B
RHPRVPALFAANDTRAASSLAEAPRQAFSLPGELSVVGFHDAPVAAQIWPARTTVHQDAAAMTERAVEILEKAVRAWREDRSALPHEDALFPYEIVHRASIAAPSGKGA